MQLLRKALAASWGTLLYSALQALALAIITREGGALDTGLFLLAQGIATPISLLTGLRLRDQVATAPEKGLVRPYAVRQVKLILPVVAAGTVLWFLFAEPTSAVVGSSILVANLAQSVAWTVQGGLLRSELFNEASAVDAILGWLAALSIAFGYVVGDLALACVLLATSWTLVSVLGLVVAGDGHWSTKLDTSVSHDLRMGISAMGTVGQISAGRIGTSILLGQPALARLGTGSFLERMSQPIARGMLKVNAPRLANAKIAGAERIATVEQSLMRLAALGSVGATPFFALLGWLVGARVVAIVFDESVVASSATYAVLLGAAPLLYASMILNQLIVSRQNSFGATAVSMLALATTVVTIWPFSALWGEPGAAASIGAGYLARCVSAWWVLRASSALPD